MTMARAMLSPPPSGKPGAAAEDLGGLLDVARAIASALHIWGCDLCMIDPRSSDIWIVASWSQEADDAAVMSPVPSFEHQQALAAMVASGERLVWQADDRQLSTDVRRWMRRRRARTAIHLPLVYAGSVSGCLTLVERRRWQLSDDEQRMLLAIAPAAAAALHNARLAKEQQESNRRLGSLLQSIRAMTSTATLADVLDIVAAQAASALDVPCTAILELERDDLVMRAVFEDNCQSPPSLGERYPLADYPYDQVLLTNGEVVQQLAGDIGLDAVTRMTMIEHGEKSVLSVPLVFRMSIVGMLEIIETRWERRFTYDERELARAIGEQAAAAIVNARLYREQEQQNLRQRSLLHASRAIASSMALPEVLQVVARVVADALDSTICVLMEYEAADDRLVYRAGYDRQGLATQDYWQTFTYCLDDFPGDRAVLDGRTVILELASDTEVDEISRESMLADDTPTYLNVPLVFGEELVGLLQIIERGRERAFGDDEIEFAAGIGEQAAIAVQAARRYRRLLEVTDDLEVQLQLRHTLLELSEVLLTLHDMAAVFEHIASVLRTLVSFDNLDISLIDPDLGDLVEVFQGEDSFNKTLGMRMPLDEGVTGAVLVGGKPEMVNDMLRDPRAVQVEGTPEDEEQASILVPLQVGSEIIGVLCVSRFEGRTFAEQEFQLVQLVTNLAAIAIDNARRYIGMQEKAVRDGLTGLFNHRHFYERLTEEVARSRRYGTALSLLMIDLDDFKRFNDRHGHLLGDRALQDVSACLLAEIRGGVDIVARYGGEEFAVLLPATPCASPTARETSGDGPADAESDPQAARPGSCTDESACPAGQVAERIRERIAGHVFTGSSGPAECLTVSVGVATLPDVAYDESQLVDHADKALYLAKRLGKNRVELYVDY